MKIQAKGISIRQPWASMIADGEKTIETRTWPTNYRGTLLICASKNPQGLGPTGVVLAVAELYDCRPFELSDVEAAQCDWYEGYGFHLRNVRKIEPVPVRGSLGLFPIEIEVNLLPS